MNARRVKAAVSGRRWIAPLLAAALIGSVPAAAAPRTEPLPPEPAVAQALLNIYQVERLPDMTDTEQKANVLWSLRSGLNVAALQCQFSPYLRTADTYNRLLRQNATELGDAFETLKRYFIRKLGARAGIRGFDTYATRANQSWSKFDAQLAFCRAAADVGKRALAVPRGDLGGFAEAEVPPLRQVAETRPRFLALEAHLEWPAIPDVATVRTRR